jgi:hypothetical protein
MGKMIFAFTLAFAAFMFWSSLETIRHITVVTGHYQQRVISADSPFVLPVR